MAAAMVGDVERSAQHFHMDRGMERTTLELREKLNRRLKIISTDEKNSKAVEAGSDSDAVSDADSEPLNYAMLPLTARLSTDEAVDILGKVRRREDKYARLKEELRGSQRERKASMNTERIHERCAQTVDISETNCLQPPDSEQNKEDVPLCDGIYSAACSLVHLNQAKDPYLTQALQRAALAEARSVALEAQLSSSVSAEKPSSISKRSPEDQWRYKWRRLIRRILERQRHVAKEEARDHVKRGKADTVNTACQQERNGSHDRTRSGSELLPSLLCPPTPIGTARVAPPPDPSPFPCLPSPRAWANEKLDGVSQTPGDLALVPPLAEQLEEVAHSLPAKAAHTTAGNPHAGSGGVLSSSTDDERLCGRSSVAHLVQFLPVVVLCCGVVYAFQSWRLRPSLNDVISGDRRQYQIDLATLHLGESANTAVAMPVYDTWGSENRSHESLDLDRLEPR